MLGLHGSPLWVVPQERFFERVVPAVRCPARFCAATLHESSGCRLIVAVQAQDARPIMVLAFVGVRFQMLPVEGSHADRSFFRRSTEATLPGRTIRPCNSISGAK